MTKNTVQIFEALSHPTRIRLVTLLAQRPLRTRDIAKRLKISEASAAHHLRVLADIKGFLTAEPDTDPPHHTINRDILAAALIDLAKAVQLDISIRATRST
jgi:DNA-binding transcriptional ArsR family regulator